MDQREQRRASIALRTQLTEMLWARLVALRSGEEDVYDAFLALIQAPGFEQPSDAAGRRLKELELVTGYEAHWGCDERTRDALVVYLAFDEHIGPGWKTNMLHQELWLMLARGDGAYADLKRAFADPRIATPASLVGHPFIEYRMADRLVFRGEVCRVLNRVLSFDGVIPV